MPVPVTTTSRVGRVMTATSQRGERGDQRVDLLVGVRGRSATRSRDVPGATVGGRIAGTSRPWSSSAARRRERRPLVADDDGDDRRRVPGRTRVDVRAQPRSQRVALGATARSPTAASAAAASAGVDAVVKM